MVGNYRIVRQIGSGGMGVVFEAIHPDIGRRAAIKVLHTELSGNPEVVARFLNEARAVNLVRHPGLVQIFEFGRLPSGAAYIVMDFLDGESLSQRMARTVLKPSQALAITAQLASALAAAHKGGIIHRDLKPDNVMLVPEPEPEVAGQPARETVRLLDFGIAKLTSTAPGGAGQSASATRAGVVMGTPEYMAPEQCLGSHAIDGKVDVYALGVILYEMLSGTRPFEAESTLELMHQHVYEMPLPLRPRLEGTDQKLGPQLVELVERLLAKNPNERPTMAELVEQLQARSASLAEPAVVVARSTASSPPVFSHPPAGPSVSETGLTVAAPITASHFIAGPPISDPRLFFGRERELRRLGNLWRQAPLQNAAIIGPRRSGKTSLLVFLRAIAGRNPQLRPGQRGDFLPPGRPPSFLFVDFQDPRLGTRDGLLRHLLRGLGLPLPASGRCELDDFMNSVSGSLRSPTVVLFDEIGVALERYAQLDIGFWEGLRALATNQVEGNLGFVLASHKPPHELALSGAGGSPFFNIFGYTATIGPLSDAEARQLIASSPIAFSATDVHWILEHSRRWPILLQILCRERLLSLQDGEPSDSLDWRAEALEQIGPFASGLK